MKVLEITDSVQETVLDAVNSAQDVVVDAVESLSGRLPALPLADRVPEVAPIVDRAFGYAEQLLESQHRFARRVVEAGAPNGSR
jgi:hypothetical protein